MQSPDRSSRRRGVAAALAVLVLACSSGCAPEEDAVVGAWQAYHRATLALDVPASRALLASGHEADLDGPDAAVALEMRSALVPARPEVTGVEVSGDRATVAVRGAVEGQPMSGRIAFTREGGAWKVAQESWDVALGEAGRGAPADFPVPDVRLAEIYAAGAEAAPRERVDIAAHEGAVTALAFTRDGSALVSIGYDDTLLCLWDAAAGRRLDAIELDTRPNDLALAPDGRAAYVVDTDGRITEWAIDAGAFGEPRFLSGLAGATPRIAVGPHGHHAVTTSWNDPAKLWDLDEGTFVRSLPKSERMRGVAFSPAGPTVVCGSSGDSFVRWNLDRLSWPVGGRKEQRVPKVSPQSDVHSVAFSPDGRRMATGHMDSSMSIWDAESGKQIHNWYVQDCSAMDVEFSPCGTVLATAQQDGKVYLWDVESRRTLARLRAHEGAALAVAFHPADGVTIATGGEDGEIRIWR